MGRALDARRVRTRTSWPVPPRRLMRWLNRTWMYGDPKSHDLRGGPCSASFGHHAESIIVHGEGIDGVAELSCAPHGWAGRRTRFVSLTGPIPTFKLSPWRALVGCFTKLPLCRTITRIRRRCLPRAAEVDAKLSIWPIRQPHGQLARRTRHHARARGFAARIACWCSTRPYVDCAPDGTAPGRCLPHDRALIRRLRTFSTGAWIGRGRGVGYCHRCAWI